MKERQEFYIKTINNSTFKELLAKDGYFKIHDRNLQKLLIEIFKVKIKLAPEIMNKVFDIQECPRNELRCESRNNHTVSYSYVPDKRGLENSVKYNQRGFGITGGGGFVYFGSSDVNISKFAYVRTKL